MPSEPPIAKLAGRAINEMTSVVNRIVRELRTEVPGYRPGEGLSDEDIRTVLTDYLTEVLAGLRGSPSGDHVALDTLMRRRVGEGITLPDMLHSYRIGVALLWESLAGFAEGDPEATSALVAATPGIFEVLDRYSLRANEIHHEIALRNARRLEQVRASLLDTVFSGDSSLGSVFWEAVALVGIPRNGHFVFVEVAPHEDQTTSESPPDMEAQVAAHPGVESAWFRVGARSQIGLVSIARSLEGSVDVILAPVLVRTATSAGTSSPFTSVADTARARAQAHVAASAVSHSRPLIRYNHDLIPVLLASAPDAANTILSETFATILELPTERRNSLLDTVRAWLDHRQSVAATAKALHCHRNTVNYRLRRFQDLTKHSLSDNSWLAQVVLALEAERRQRG